MIRIKRVKRIAVAVKDLDAAIENWKRLFGIKPFLRGEEPEDRYAWVVFQIGGTAGDGEMTIEFLSPLNDPDGEMLIGKFIKNRGEGLYMFTMETEGSADEVSEEIKATGLSPSWSGQQKEWRGDFFKRTGFVSWAEHYISPKDANGVLCTLASVIYPDPELIVSEPAYTLPAK